MHTIVQKIWHGDLCPSSEPGIYREKTLELCELIERHNHDLSQMLDEKGKEALEKLNDAYMETLCLDSEDAFTKGFALGMKLSAAALFS